MYGWRDGVLDVIKGIGKGMEWGGYMMTGAGLIMEAGGTGTMGGGFAVASTGVGAPAGGTMVAGGAATAVTGWGLAVTGAATSALGLSLQMAANGDCPDELVDLWAPGAPPNDTPKANFLDHAKRKGPEFGLDPDDLVGFGNKAKELLDSLKGRLSPIRNNNPRNPGGRKSASRVIGDFYEYVQTTKNNLIITIGKQPRR